MAGPSVQTPKLHLPYPDPNDTVDVPRDMGALALGIDPLVSTFASGTAAARPAAGISGRFYWDQDFRKLYYDDGTTWQSASGSVAVGSSLPILDVGMVGQNRAGRQLTVADFTNIGLTAPTGLWNLGDLTNLGSDGRALFNKGTVPFGVGINGLASSAAVFAGSTGQALYIADSGAADPFRIKTGSWGCWFRTAKRGTAQNLIGKLSAAAGNYSYFAQVSANNAAGVGYSVDGSTFGTTSGVSDVADDRWHFLVTSWDGTTLRCYIDGVLEATLGGGGPMFAGNGPFNIGGLAADSGAVASQPTYGRVDEAFVTADVLSEDQIRCLYAAKLVHTLGVAPTGVRLNVRRRRKGGALAVSDFTTQPIRLHNFTAGALTDQGSGNVALTNNGTAVSVSGADGTPGGAFGFTGAQSLSATDAGLPAGTAARSYGCWFKTTTANNGAMIGWGTIAGNALTALWVASNGAITNRNVDDIIGPYVADGQWHCAVCTEDNAAGDGVRRKLYVDGRLTIGTTTLGSITLAGANRFRIGAWPDDTSRFTGQIDGAFVTGYALTAADVAALYAKGSQDLGVSPKNSGDHVERADATSLLFIGDTLESQHTIDMAVVA